MGVAGAQSDLRTQVPRPHSTLPGTCNDSQPNDLVVSIERCASQMPWKPTMAAVHSARQKVALARVDSLSPGPTHIVSSPSISSLASADSEPDHDVIIVDVAPSSPPDNHVQGKRERRVACPDSMVENRELVRIVLDLYDFQRLEWTMIADPIYRMWGIEATSATILEILQQNERIQRTTWWD